MSAAFRALLDRSIGHFLSLLEATGTFIAKILVSWQEISLGLILVLFIPAPINRAYCFA